MLLLFYLYFEKNTIVFFKRINEKKKKMVQGRYVRRKRCATIVNELYKSHILYGYTHLLVNENTLC